MRALVTGACGFVGGHLVQHLCSSGDQVLATLFAPGVSAPPAAESVRYTRLDVSDAESVTRVVEEFKPEVVYHLAGIAFVPEAEENFNKALIANVGATNNIFRACHLLKIPATIVYVSSAEAYGRFEPAELPLRETQPLRPTNNYSLSKVMGELVAERYARAGIVRSVIVRPFNHIGPGQNSRFVASSFAKQLAEIALGLSEPVLKVGNLEAKRDFSDVRDIVRGYRLAAQRSSGVFNLGASASVPVRAILDTLIEISGVKVTVTQDHTRMRPAEIPEVIGDCSKARDELGWRCTVPLRQSLTDVYRYWESNLRSSVR